MLQEGKRYAYSRRFKNNTSQGGAVGNIGDGAIASLLTSRSTSLFAAPQVLALGRRESKSRAGGYEANEKGSEDHREEGDSFDEVGWLVSGTYMKASEQLAKRRAYRSLIEIVSVG